MYTARAQQIGRTFRDKGEKEGKEIGIIKNTYLKQVQTIESKSTISQSPPPYVSASTTSSSTSPLTADHNHH